MAKFPELINDLASLKNDVINLTNEISAHDDNIYKMIDESIDGLECSLDVCNNPNREVQTPFTKIYTEHIDCPPDDQLLKKVVEEFNGYKKSFENSSQKVSDLVKTCRQQLKGTKQPVEDIKTETDKSYTNYKEAINILAYPLTYVIKGFDAEEFRKKDFKDKGVLKKFKQLLDDLKTTFDNFKGTLKQFNENTLSIFKNVTETDNSFSTFIEKKMLGKIKDIPLLLYEGIKILPETSRKINKFYENIKKKGGDTTEECQKFYDEVLNNILKKTKSVDDQVYNSNKGIDEDFKELSQKVVNIKKEIEKNADKYNKYVKDLKEFGKKIIEIVDEIRKLFDKPPLELKFEDKDLKYPFYEFAKKLNVGFEKIEEIKKEIQKPMKLVMVVFGKQINMVTLDLLFIMDITESMQDLLDETRDSIKYILDKIKQDSPGIDVRFAYEGYRDFQDLQEGEKYYTIDFETDSDVFKSKLNEIVAKGGGDDAEDVAGGLFAGLNMSWRSNARYAILIADAPGHGNKYHDKEVEDHYPDGDPNGHVLEDLMAKYVDKNINLNLARIDDYTDIMFAALKKSFEASSSKKEEKPKIAIIEYDYESDETIQKKETKNETKKNQSNRKLGDLVAKTAIEIYNKYSKKSSIGSK